jgi:hypothetical protein
MIILHSGPDTDSGAGQLELVFIFAIMALLFLGPRRHGGMPSSRAKLAGILFLLWFIMAVALGWYWRTLFGDIPQP